MTNRSLFFLSGIAVFAILALFLLKLSPSSLSAVPEKYISHNDVRGSAIIYNDLPYTLNFEQQQNLIRYLNMAIPVGVKAFKINDNLPVKKIIIYRFNAPQIELSLITYDGKDVIFSAPNWNPGGYLRDVSDGEFRKLLEGAHDH